VTEEVSEVGGRATGSPVTVLFFADQKKNGQNFRFCFVLLVSNNSTNFASFFGKSRQFLDSSVFSILAKKGG
jgi:hypothetical protein